MPKKKADFKLDTALDELEGLVHAMEKGDLGLEEALSTFEKGIQLTKQCQQALTAAERQVSILTKEAGTEALVAFETATDSVNDADE